MVADGEKLEPFILDTGCFLHPACLTCPELICIFEFPGGYRNYKRYRQLLIELQVTDLNGAAEALGLSLRQTQRLFHLGNRAMKHIW